MALERNLQRGDVVLVALPQNRPQGREQQGLRPAIVVGIPPGETRYLVVVVAPLTTQSGDWVERNPVMYPRLEAGVGGLTQESIVLLDQVRAVDARRITRYLGTLSPQQYAAIASGIQQLFGS